MTKNALLPIAEFFIKAFNYAGGVLKSEDAFKSYMKKMGWIVNDLPASYTTVASSMHTALEAYNNLRQQQDISYEDIYTILETVSNVYQFIKDISDVPSNISGADIALFLNDLRDYFIQSIFIDFLKEFYPREFGILSFVGVISSEEQPHNSNTIFSRYILDFSALKNFITNPGDHLADIFGWGVANLPLYVLTEKVYSLLSGIFEYSNYVFTDSNTINNLQRLIGDTVDVRGQMIIPVYSFDGLNGASQDIGMRIILGVYNDAGQYPFIAFFPFYPSSVQYTYQINDSLKLSFNANSNLANKFLLFISTQEVKLKYLDIGDAIANLNFGMNLMYGKDSPTLILGKEGGTRLQLGGADLGFTIGTTNGEPELEVDLNVKNLQLVISAGEGDSFIAKTISGEKAIVVDFGILWSSKTGLHFAGGGGFQYSFNPHISLGPLAIDDLSVKLYALLGNDDGVSLDVTAGVALNLGPLNVAVKNIGISLKARFEEGNVGPLDVKLGFRPPAGIGLSINASAVKGGGFLNYDETTWTYTGGLELAFSKISFSAIGIVSTKLPGGKPGYSLLIIISAEFTPIQLGMGFTLNGIGGILGLNRTMNPDVLRNGIRDNTLDSILFPKDIVKNANTIISNIGQAFPTKEGQFLVGPMAKIGWGTPTLLTIELGIIIELPEPVRLAILGVIKALLPSKENAIIKIQVNFLGIIDFTNKYLSFDASLYDSQILTFGLFGDMALRLYWGDKPNFLLSVGGFHPRFTPPPLNLPQLRRLTIVLANQDNLKISVETYFALTSNSVQFGAKVAAMAKAWKIQAIGALWFDILFQFSPFYFIADMGVMFAIKMGSKTILSLYVNLTLEGPNPWRARGKGSFKVLFVKVSVSFDKTFGQARVEAIQAEAIDAKVKAALVNRDNWEALLPGRSHQLISWREEDLSDPNTELSVDPAGALKISQRLIPLTTSMAKFGSSAISDFNRYEVTDVKAGTDSLPRQTVQDYFARNEFFYMKDDEKLSRPSYELFDSGVVAGADRIDSQYAVHRKCHYEEITLDSGYRRPEPIYFLSLDQFRLHAFGNYVSRSGLSSFDRITTSAGPNRVKVDLQDEQFVLINRNDMSQVSGYFSNSLDAERHLATEMASAPATAADWIVANRFEL